MLHKHAQSAMEYLMTYGWAILVIAIVLGGAYSLGLFGSGSAAVSTSCLAQSGFLCTTPILNTNGILAVEFGQISPSPITITGLGCTTSSTAPTSSEQVSTTVQPGSTLVLAFSCPLSSNALSSTFTGVLWITYNTPSQGGIVSELGSVSARVSTSGNVIAAEGGGSSAGSLTSSTTTSTTSTSSTSTTATSTTSSTSTSTVTTIHYVPITLTNSQSNSIAAGTPVPIAINSNSYSSNIASDWDNVLFTTGAAGAGSNINAWIEANPQNSAVNTIVWVKLPGSIAGSGGTLTIYMNFMPSSQFSSSGPLGEAPQYSATYGQYDDGGVMGFTAYTGFEGSSFSSPWYANGGSVSNGYTASIGSGNYWAIPGESTNYGSGIAYMGIASISGSPLACWDNGSTCVFESFVNAAGIISLANSGTSSFFIIDSLGQAVTETAYWAFVAPYPPGGTYPGAGFGSLV
ncbi:MAG: hypothetical protein KGH78_04445 [Candidatus Micrarchaeota archaeon]|nr:hypothetical protein [Candidatus Micrarchaeota archaeon]